MIRLNDLMDQKDIPVVIADHQGFIKYVNHKFEETFAWTSADLVGRLVSVIIPPQFRDAHHLGFSRFLTTGAPTLLNQPLDLEIILGNGEKRTARHFIIAEPVDDNWVLGAQVELLD